jgi:purine-binding chemotaxis protein CheW
MRHIAYQIWRGTDKMTDVDLQNNLEQDEDTQKDKYLTFSVGNEFYAIEIRYVTEIIGIQSITEVPELPEYIKGIINLRGKIIPVMDVRIRFRKEPRQYNDRTCIIVIDIEEASVGLIVDSVSEVLSIDEKNIVIPPDVGGSNGKYIKSMGKVNDDVKLILDCQELLSEDELQLEISK